MAKKHTKTTLKTSRSSLSLRPRLAHPRHSFRLLERHHTSSSLLVFLCLLTGIFSYGWTTYASGDTSDDYAVNAVVPAEGLTEPATITAPRDGATWHESAITVRGTCPSNSYVQLFRNQQMLGVALCQADNTWNIAALLTLGANQLQVRVFNLTDAAGPVASPVTVYYSVGTVTSATNSNSPAVTTSTEAQPELALSSDFRYQATIVGQEFFEIVHLSGGVAPYAVSTDWGDGSSDLRSVASIGNLELRHTYHEPGGYQHSYTIMVKATDAKGSQTSLQLVALITPIGGGATTPSPSQGSGSPLQQAYGSYWRLAAPTYAVIFVALSSFWLGQHRELEILRQKAMHHHRRRPV